MRHPATQNRVMRRVAGNTPDYRKLNGPMKTKKSMQNRKNESNNSHGHKSDQSSLRLDRGDSAG